MKRFRGLTFKIFLLLFVSFMIAFGIIVKNKYDNSYDGLLYGVDNKTEMRNYADYLSLKYTHSFYENFQDKYDIDMLKEDVNNAPKLLDSITCILDQDGKLLAKSGFKNDDRYICVNQLSQIDDDLQNDLSFDHYYIDVSSFPNEQIDFLIDNIKQAGDLHLDFYFDGDIQEINDFSQSSSNISIRREKYYVVKPTFLHYNRDILGNMNLEDAHRGYFDSFYKDGEILTMENSSDFYITNFFTYEEINNLIDKTIDECFDDVSVQSFSYDTSKITEDLYYKDKNLIKYLVENKLRFDDAEFRKITSDYTYMMTIKPLLVLPDQNVNDEHVGGYIVCFYNFTNMGTDMIVYGLIEENKGLMIAGVLFVTAFSYFISYLITRRIKLIDQVAMEIADNNFDVQLSTKGHDELSSLSGHINTMSANLKRNIEQLHLEIDQVKKMEDLRKEFIAHFTHEIKTPLAIINGNVDFLEETEDSQKRKQYADVINKEIKIINDLILQMLDLSKLEAKAITLEKENVNLKELSEDIIDEYEQLLKEKRLLIQLDGDDIEIYADKKRIAMVIQNYLSNAIKHALYQSTIQISMSKQRFSIENKGKHIDDEMKEKIWLSFISDNRQGTGLGLAICKNILELHDFTYGVYNSNDGVVFYFDWSHDK